MSNQHQTRTGCTRPVLTLLAIAFFLAIGIFIWRTYTYRSLEDGIRAKGEPVTLAELDAWYTFVPEERNAAQFVLLAMDQFHKPAPDAPIPFVTRYEWEGQGTPLPDDAKSAMAEFLASNKDCLELLAQAAELGECRYPVVARTALGGSLTHLETIRNLASLQIVAAIQKADSGDSRGAAESSIRVFRLGETLAKEPLLISQLVRNACHAIAVKSVSYTVNSGQIAEESLKALQSQIQASEDPGALHRALAGERCFTTDTTYGFGGGMNGMLWQFFRSSAARTYTRMVDASQLPSLERRQRFQQIAQEINPPGKGGFRFYLNPLAAILVPVFALTVDGFDRDTAQLHVAATAIGVERYRLANGKLPDTLNALVPSYLETVPVDPFDGKPLRYVQGDFGYTVYSIGMNLEDDRGAEPTKGNPKTGDIVLKVTR